MQLTFKRKSEAAFLENPDVSFKYAKGKGELTSGYPSDYLGLVARLNI